MNDPCDIWFRIFVVVFILISTGTFLVLILRFVLYVYFVKNELAKCERDESENN